MNDFLVTLLLKRCVLPVALVSGLVLSGCNDGTDPGPESNSSAQQHSHKEEQRVISGKVMYRERIALPENATVTVMLADVSRADAPMKVLAEEHIDNPGQVPVSFSLRYQTAAVSQSNPNAYAISADIRNVDGNVLWTTTERYPVDLTSDIPPGDITLMLRRAASEEAISLSPAMQDARGAGASFWAMGNEPGWHVAIYPDERIVFVGDYGNSEVSLPFVDPVTEGTETQYQTGDAAHQITLSISDRGCQDTMSGNHYEYDVLVALNGQEYRGCGRNL